MYQRRNRSAAGNEREHATWVFVNMAYPILWPSSFQSRHPFITNCNDCPVLPPVPFYIDLPLSSLPPPLVSPMWPVTKTQQSLPCILIICSGGGFPFRTLLFLACSPLLLLHPILPTCLPPLSLHLELPSRLEVSLRHGSAHGSPSPPASLAPPLPPSHPPFTSPPPPSPPSCPQYASGLAQLSASVEEVFASGDLPRVADTLSNMRRCLEVVGDVSQTLLRRIQSAWRWWKM